MRSSTNRVLGSSTTRLGDMAKGKRHRVSDVGRLRHLREISQQLNHPLNLVLGCAAVSRNRKLHLSGRILDQSDTPVEAGQMHQANCLADRKSGLGVLTKKNSLDRHDVGLEL